MMPNSVGKTIGVVGGVGPIAGVDLVHRIHDVTLASRDQDHLNVLLLSLPSSIPDRTEFLLGRGENPAYAIAQVIRRLDEAGAEIVGIPCNTTHVPAIFDVVKTETERLNCNCQVLDMVTLTVDFLVENLPEIKRVGALTTTGTYTCELYPSALRQRGLTPICLQPDQQEHVHAAIYDREFGIKAHTLKATQKAVQLLHQAISQLQEQGAQAVILGCTEISLALAEGVPHPGLEIIDPAVILARELVRLAAPEKLKHPCGGT